MASVVVPYSGASDGLDSGKLLTLFTAQHQGLRVKGIRYAPFLRIDVVKASGSIHSEPAVRRQTMSSAATS